MFLTDNYCYVDMDKTGTVYINNILANLNKNYNLQHHALPSHEIINNTRIVKFGSIRDPWSWYVSLWSYACKNKGMAGIYNNLVKFKPLTSYGSVDKRIHAFIKKNTTFFQLNLNTNTVDLFKDPSDPLNFRKWLTIVLSDKYAPIVDYPLYHSGLYQHCGLYTKEVIRYYFENHKLNNGIIDLDTGLNAYLINNCYVSDFIRTSSINKDLMALMNKYDLHKNMELTQYKRANCSTIDVQHYDKYTYHLVLEKEKCMLDYFLQYHNINLYKPGIIEK